MHLNIYMGQIVKHKEE